jgi:hypothetical protein
LSRSSCLISSDFLGLMSRTRGTFRLVTVAYLGITLLTIFFPGQQQKIPWVAQPQTFYKLTADSKYGQAAENTKRHVGRFFTTDDSKNKVPSNLSLIMGHVDSDDSPLSTSRELLQQHEFGYPLNDTANSAQQIEAMMRQTLGVEADTMTDEEKEVPDKKPPEDNDDQDILFKDVTEGEMAPLDASYPKMRVSSNDEKQQTLHRMSTMPESTYQEAVKNETYRENGNNVKNVEGEIAPLDALYPTMQVLSDYEKQETTHKMSATYEITYKEDVKKIAPLDALYPTMRVNSDSKNQQTHNRKSVVDESTNQDDVMNKTHREYRKSSVHESTYQEDMMNKTYREKMMSAMHENTYQEDVKDKAYMENVDVPGAVANTSSSNYGPEDPQNNCMAGQTGTKDNTKMLAVTTIASERGGGRSA